jgi:glycosyltransferase involved in cell wall biosynthesis
MAAAKPVIAPRVGAIPEIVDDQVCGFLYAPGDEEALVDRILTTLHDEDLRMRMGTSGRQKVKTHYNWDQIVHRYLALYAGLS